MGDQQQTESEKLKALKVKYIPAQLHNLMHWLPASLLDHLCLLQRVQPAIERGKDALSSMEKYEESLEYELV